MYVLRDKNGLMKAKLSERALKMVMDGTYFSKRLRKFTCGEVMTIEIEDDGRLHCGFVDVFLWEGDYIELYKVG